MKGDVVDGAFPQWMSSDVLNDLEDSDTYCEGADFGDDAHDDEEHTAHKYSGLGSKGKSNQNEMDAARMGAKEAGWLDESPNGIAEVDKDPVEPEVHNSSAQWKAAVNDTRLGVEGQFWQVRVLILFSENFLDLSGIYT
jgi:hypothetical protein